MRLIDDLRRPDAAWRMPYMVAEWNQENWKKYVAHVSPLIKNPALPVLLIDNVADYYFTSDQEHWDLRRDFPNLAPPFQTWWSEHKLPRVIHSKECGDTPVKELCSGRVGMLFTALEAGKDQWKGENVPPETRWILWADIWIDYGERGVTAQGPHGATFLAIDAEGRLLDVPCMQSFAPESMNEIARSLMSWYHPALLAVSFLHCKNVTLVDNVVDKPLARKYHARHGIHPTPYRTLVIEPLKAILRKEGGMGAGNGLAKALHICRGHFKDYREGRGLFGRYHQLVWQPSIVRGTKGKATPPREMEIKV